MNMNEWWIIHDCVFGTVGEGVATNTSTSHPLFFEPVDCVRVTKAKPVMAELIPRLVFTTWLSGSSVSRFASSSTNSSLLWSRFSTRSSSSSSSNALQISDDVCCVGGSSSGGSIDSEPTDLGVQFFDSGGDTAILRVFTETRASFEGEHVMGIGFWPSTRVSDTCRELFALMVRVWWRLSLDSNRGISQTGIRIFEDAEGPRE